ncbi:MAG: hypothetical protein Gyms2KO_19040 [Gymnodinialimonas sp.]
MSRCVRSKGRPADAPRPNTHPPSRAVAMIDSGVGVICPVPNAFRLPNPKRKDHPWKHWPDA